MKKNKFYVLFKNLLPDKLFLNLKYFKKFNKFVNFKNPVLFNQKINYLKIYDDTDDKTSYQDKLKVKDIIKEKIGPEYVIETYKVLDLGKSFKEQTEGFDKFILKTNFESGKVYICSNKAEFDFSFVEEEIKKQFKEKAYLEGREYHYSRIEKKVFIERLLDDHVNLIDYKIYCFNGLPKYFHLDVNRHTNHQRCFYDDKWNKIENVTLHYPYYNGYIQKPEKLDEMLNLAKIISSSFKFVRVDFYYINNRIYFGEATFYPGSGFEKFSNPIYEEIFGELLKLK